MKTFIKQAKQKAKDEAVKTAKQMFSELGEFPKDASSKLAGTEYNATRPDTNPDDKLSPKPKYYENPGIKKAKLDYLQRELEELKQKRKQEEYLHQKQESDAKEKQNENDENTFKGNPWEAQIPKRKIGLPFLQGKKAKGTGEMIRSKK